MSIKLLQLKQLITFQQANEIEISSIIPENNKIVHNDQTIVDAQQALQTSVNVTKQLVMQKEEILSAYQQIKQDYNKQNQRIHDIEQEIGELLNIKQMMDDLPDLTTNFAAQNILEGMTLFNTLNSVFKQEFKPSTQLQKNILNLTNTQSYIQNLIDSLHIGCEHLLSEYYQKKFSFELKFINQLQDNTFNKECQSTLIYDIIDYTFSKFTEILPNISESQPDTLISTILNQFQSLKFTFLQDSLYVVNDLFSCFATRLMKLIKQQFDIRFMGSSQFDKQRQITVQQASKRWIKLFTSYMEQFFQAQQINLLFDKQFTLTSDLLITQSIRPKIEETKGIVQKTIKFGIDYFYKKPKQAIVAEILTNCKNVDIKNCFMRKYVINDAYPIEMHQQLVIDQVVMIVYKFLEQIEFVMGWKWETIDQSLYDELIIGLEGSVCKELIGQVVQGIIAKMQKDDN